MELRYRKSQAKSGVTLWLIQGSSARPESVAGYQTDHNEG